MQFSVDIFSFASNTRELLVVAVTVALLLVFIDTSLNEAENLQGKSFKLIILTENKLLTLSLVLVHQ